MLASLLAAVVVLLWLLMGARAFGWASTSVAVGLDRMSGFFLLWWLVERVGLVAAGCGVAGRGVAGLGGLVAFGAMDGTGLLAGVALAGLGRRGGGLAGVLVLGALALLEGGTFEAMRAVALSATGLVGVVAMTAGAAVLIGGPLGMYVLSRVLLDLADGAAGWSGGLALLLGGGIALAGAWRAWRATGFQGVRGGLATMLAGFGIMGSGVAIAGQAIDFTGPVMLGSGVLWLATALGATGVPVLGLLGDGALARGSGAMRRARIGGIGCVAACIGLALVPPGAGFGVLWQMLRALQTLPVPPLVGAAGAAGACAAMGFAAAAMLRLMRIGFAVGEDGDPPERLVRGAMVGLGALVALIGVMPGAVIALAGGVSEILYAPAGMALVLAALCGGTAVLVRRSVPGGIKIVALPAEGAAVALSGLGAGPLAWWAGRVLRGVRRRASGADVLALRAVAGGVLVALALLLVWRVSV